MIDRAVEFAQCAMPIRMADDSYERNAQRPSDRTDAVPRQELRMADAPSPEGGLRVIETTIRTCDKCRRTYQGAWTQCPYCCVPLGAGTTIAVADIFPLQGLTDGTAIGDYDQVVIAAGFRSADPAPEPQILEGAGELLSQSLALMREYGGRAYRLAGRGIVAVWGVLEEDAANAARALCALQILVERATHRAGTSRAGLSFGIGAVLARGPINPVERAFRFAAAAHTNLALVSDDFGRRITTRFDLLTTNLYLPHPRIIENPQVLVAAKTAHSGTQHVGADPIPMVGRQELKDALTEALTASLVRPTIVHIIGDAGLGKSKLLRDWLAQTAMPSEISKNAIFSTTGVPYADYPLRAWNDLFKPLALSRDGVTTTPKVARVEVLLNARDGLTILLLDDVHWLDFASLEAVLRLIERLHRYFIIFAYRRSYNPRLLERLPGDHRVLQLAPLSAGEVDQLATIHASERHLTLSPHWRREIASHSQGSPFYIREAVAHIAEVGVEDLQSLPKSLMDMLVTRAKWTSERRIADFERRRRQLRLHPPSERAVLVQDIARAEEELSLWLDRFDIMEDASPQLLVAFQRHMRRINVDLGLLAVLLRTQRPQQGRLAQALTRIDTLMRYVKRSAS
jgi:hypothetical protein